MSREFSITLPSPPVESLEELGAYVRESQNPYSALCVVLTLLVNDQKLNTKEKLDLLQDVGAVMVGRPTSKRAGFKVS